MSTAYRNLQCRSHLSSAGRGLVLATALSLVLGSSARAQHPSGVTVVFHARLPAYQLPPAVEQEVSGRIAKICVRKFPYWQYTSSPETDFPQLHVEVTKDASGKLMLAMWLVLEQGGTSIPATPWKDALFAPGDFLLSPVLPKDQDAPEFFSRSFEDRMLSNSRTVSELWAALSNGVPLGRSVVLILPPLAADKPRAVLPINWRDHCHEFAEADFIILSKTANNEKVNLFSSGINQPLDYKPDLRQFSGVGVQINFLQRTGDPQLQAIDANARDQVLTLIPIEFHLKEAKSHISSCSDDASSAPSIAP